MFSTELYSVEKSSLRFELSEETDAVECKNIVDNAKSENIWAYPNFVWPDKYFHRVWNADLCR